MFHTPHLHTPGLCAVPQIHPRLSLPFLSARARVSPPPCVVRAARVALEAERVKAGVALSMAVVAQHRDACQGGVARAESRGEGREERRGERREERREARGEKRGERRKERREERRRVGEEDEEEDEEKKE